MTFDPSNHEHDDEDRCLDSDGQPIVLAESAARAKPQWMWSWWEVPAVLASMVSGIAREVSQATAYLSREFVAAANLSRTKRVAFEQEVHQIQRRRMIADDIRSLEGGDSDG